MIHIYRIFDFLLRLLIYYAYYKAKQAFLSFLPAFERFPLFSFIYRIFRRPDIFIVAECVFYPFFLITRVFIGLSRSSVRFSLVFTNLPVFTAFQHVFLCLSVFPRFSLLYPLIFEFCYIYSHVLIIFTRFCIFDRFYRLFLGFRPVSGISAHFSLFFNCFTGFCSVFNDFLPLCRFSGKKSLILCFYRLSAAIYAVLTSSTLFFRIIGRSPPF